MKNLKTILALLIFASSIMSCSKDDEPAAKVIAREYPADMIINQWNGSSRETDFGNTPEKMLEWHLKANGVLEVSYDEGVFQQTRILGEWYMQGNIFYCTYISKNEKKYTYKLLKNKSLVMIGFRGINGETSGAGRVYIYVI